MIENMALDACDDRQEDAHLDAISQMEDRVLSTLDRLDRMIIRLDNRVGAVEKALHAPGSAEGKLDQLMGKLSALEARLNTVMLRPPSAGGGVCQTGVDPAPDLPEEEICHLLVNPSPPSHLDAKLKEIIQRTIGEWVKRDVRRDTLGPRCGACACLLIHPPKRQLSSPHRWLKFNGEARINGE